MADEEAADGRITIMAFRTEQGARLTVVGDLDLVTYERFCIALTDEADRQTREALTLDMTGVGYTDLPSWRIIVATARQMAARGRPFRVALKAGGQAERFARQLGIGGVVPGV